MFVEVTNGFIAVITGLILYAITRTFRWARSVDKRLSRIEKKISDDDE